MSIGQYGVADDLETNLCFHNAVRWIEPVSRVGIPFTGDIHFKDYSFVNEKDGVFRYHYYLGGAELFPSYYLFDKAESRINLRLTMGLKARVWNKRREPLRTGYSWRASHAIKTPSFMPGAYVSLLLKSDENQQDHTLHFLQVGYTHHSNGQDAPTLVAQDTTLSLPPGMKYNIADGDFSTNYLTIAYYRSRYIEDKRAVIFSVYGILDELASKKSEHRDLHKYKLGAEQRWLFNLHFDQERSETLFNGRLDLWLQVGLRNLDNFSASKNISYAISYHHRLPFSSTVAAFVRYGYWGQDDYNIYLEHNYHYLHFGFSFAHFGLYQR